MFQTLDLLTWIELGVDIWGHGSSFQIFFPYVYMYSPTKTFLLSCLPQKKINLLLKK